MIKVTEGKAWLGMVTAVLFRGFVTRLGCGVWKGLGRWVFCNNRSNHTERFKKMSGRSRASKMFALRLLDVVLKRLSLNVNGR